MAAGAFIGMWALMMVPMMAPAFVPMAARYRGPVSGMTLSYFAIWTLLGVVVMPVVPWASMAPPAVSAAVVLLAGLWQFTPWKARQLAACRHARDCRNDGRPNYPASLWHGARMGLRCVYCCANHTAVLLVLGVMDLGAMALVTLAITAERLLPARSHAPRVIGAALMGAGGYLLLA
jgi:predicted metal-binding membrane protein